MEGEQKRKKAEYRSSLRSKALIRNALVSLLQEKPFEKITITDIVRKADINRGTFYAHYRDTTEVLEKIRKDVISDISDIFSVMSADMIINNPRQFFTLISDWLMENEDYYKKLLSISGAYDLIAEVKHSAVDYLLTAERMKRNLNRNYAVSILDFIVSASCNLYLDILTSRIPLTLSDAPDFLSGIITKLKT